LFSWAAGYFPRLCYALVISLPRRPFLGFGLFVQNRFSARSRPCTKSRSKGVLLVQAGILNQKSVLNQKSETKKAAGTCKEGFVVPPPTDSVPRASCLEGWFYP
jgi:hypothetical protein